MLSWGKDMSHKGESPTEAASVADAECGGGEGRGVVGPGRWCHWENLVALSDRVEPRTVEVLLW